MQSQLAKTKSVQSSSYDPAEVATSDGPCRSGSTSWYQDGEMPPRKESYLEVPEVQDEEVETLVGDLRDVFDDV